jgi:hypothetical protein
MGLRKTMKQSLLNVFSVITILAPISPLLITENTPRALIALSWAWAIYGTCIWVYALNIHFSQDQGE